MQTPKLRSLLAIDALDTSWLLFIGCGSMMLGSQFLTEHLSDEAHVQPGMGCLCVVLVFGQTITTKSYVFDRVSGPKFDPAIKIVIAGGAAVRLERRVAVPVSTATGNQTPPTVVPFFNGDGTPNPLGALRAAPMLGSLGAGATFAFITDDDKLSSASGVPPRTLRTRPSTRRARPLPTHNLKKGR